MEFLPIDIIDNIKEYLIFKPKIKEELKTAVDLWCENKEDALMKYGHISLWNTSLITNMSHLFENKKHFNDNINTWDVSSVTNMQDMFRRAFSFNQPLNSWNISNVEDMNNMFDEASSFDSKNALWYNYFD